jgi:hypothetical protein
MNLFFNALVANAHRGGIEAVAYVSWGQQSLRNRLVAVRAKMLLVSEPCIEPPNVFLLTQTSD